jgi:phosphoribosylanthranilate isomerase
MRIKICGITNYEDAKLCCDLGADSIGFIFYSKSKRYLDLDSAKSIIKKLPFFIHKIGVFVNEDIEYINRAASLVKLTGIQLHGGETPEQVHSAYYPVIKSFRISSGYDYTLLKKYSNCSYLLDHFTNESYGGTGKSFEWDSIPNDLLSKIILSGGISIDNINNVFEKYKPEAIDISSSLEEYPGKKDHYKVKQFFRKYRMLNNVNYDET